YINQKEKRQFATKSACQKPRIIISHREVKIKPENFKDFPDMVNQQNQPFRPILLVMTML
nr:hypothetical protein [Candidatus Wallbacteria bacterium]